MNFIEAVKAMQDGKRVTTNWRNSSGQSYALSKKFDGCTRSIEDYSYGTTIHSTAILHDVDFLAEDWEVVEEE